MSADALTPLAITAAIVFWWFAWQWVFKPVTRKEGDEQ